MERIGTYAVPLIVVGIVKKLRKEGKITKN